MRKQRTPEFTPGEPFFNSKKLRGVNKGAAAYTPVQDPLLLVCRMQIRLLGAVEFHATRARLDIFLSYGRNGVTGIFQIVGHLWDPSYIRSIFASIKQVRHTRN
jgi:hypothetical protein